MKVKCCSCGETFHLIQGDFGPADVCCLCLENACEDCNGTGGAATLAGCPTCGGTGVRPITVDTLMDGLAEFSSTQSDASSEPRL